MDPTLFSQRGRKVRLELLNRALDTISDWILPTSAGIFAVLAFWFAWHFDDVIVWLLKP